MTENLPESHSSNVTLGDAGEIDLPRLQKIYEALTGASQTLATRHSNNVRLSIDDVVQLHHYITQTLTQFHVKSQNCDVTVFYRDDMKQTFCSFEDFERLHASSTNYTERLVIKYNVLIVQPLTQRAQNYKITKLPFS